MKVKLLVIFACVFLIIPTTISVSGKIYNDYERKNDFDYYYEFGFINGQINNLSEKEIDGKIYYIFHVESVKAIVFMYVPLIHFHVQRDIVENVDTGFPKNNFIGKINENSIFGIYYGRLEI